MQGESIPRERPFLAFAAPRGGIGKSTVVRHVGRLLARGSGSGWRPRVLYVDFDRERGGLSSTLEPEPIQGQPGWLECVVGAIRGTDTEWQAMLERFRTTHPTSILRRIPEPSTGNAAAGATPDPDAAVAAAPMLYYLPCAASPGAAATADADATPITTTGESESEAGRIQRVASALGAALAQLLLEPSESPARHRLAELRARLAEDFEYVLLDLESGTTAFDHCRLLLRPDATVILFRPVVSQLVASATLAFSAFLAASEADPHFVPVVPLLTQRPAMAEGQLAAIREFGETEVFPWLSADLELHGPEWHELPYDAGAAVDAAPMLEGREWDPLEDPAAPFTAALSNLASTLRALNALRDPIGAAAMASQHAARGDAGLGARFLAAALRTEPDALSRWRALGESFVGLCDENATVRAEVMALAADFPLLDDSRAVDARCYAQLWRALAVRGQHALQTRRQLVALWEWSQSRTLHPRALVDLLKYVASTQGRRTRDTDSRGPSGADASRQRLRLLATELSETTSRAGAARSWAAVEAPQELVFGLFAFARHHVERLEDAQTALLDVIRLESSLEDTAHAQWRLGELLALHARDEEALVAFNAAAAGVTAVQHDARERRLQFLCSIAPESQVFAAIEQHPADEEHGVLRAHATLRVSREPDEIVGAIQALRADSDDLPGSLLTTIGRAIARAPSGSLVEYTQRILAELPAWACWTIRLRAIREFAAWVDDEAPLSDDIHSWAMQYDPARALNGCDPRVAVLAIMEPELLKARIQAVSAPVLPIDAVTWQFLRHYCTADEVQPMTRWQRLRIARSGLPAALQRVYARRNDHERLERLQHLGFSAPEIGVAPLELLEPDSAFTHVLQAIVPEHHSVIAARWNEMFSAGL